jgi:hypothetical protein
MEEIDTQWVDIKDEHGNVIASTGCISAKDAKTMSDFAKISNKALLSLFKQKLDEATKNSICTQSYVLCARTSQSPLINLKAFSSKNGLDCKIIEHLTEGKDTFLKFTLCGDKDAMEKCYFEISQYLYGV